MVVDEAEWSPNAAEREAIRQDFWAAFDAFMPGSDAAEPAGERVRQEA